MMAYDDIAMSGWNPYKGQIFHEEGHKTNVYPGTEKIDIKGKDVTAERFMNVISTELKSTKNDDLFIYFDDHGDAGMLCFPDTLLYADDLKSAMKKMEENGKYGRCLFGIEA